MPSGFDMEDPPMISKYEHEKALMHYGMVNKRSMISLICVCVTFVVITTIFVIAYTIRERNWLNTISQLRTPAAVTEVQEDGSPLHQ